MASWRCVCVSVWRTNWELFMNILNNFDICCWVANDNSRSRQTVNRFCSWRIASWGIKTTKLYTIIYHLRLDCADIFSSLSSYLPLYLSPCLNSLRFSFVSFRSPRCSLLFCTLFCCWHLSESSAKNNIQVCLSQSRLGECDKNKGQKC